MKSHCRRSATALDQALSMDGYPHSSTLDTKNVSKRIKPSIVWPCTCPLHGLPFAHPEGQRMSKATQTARYSTWQQTAQLSAFSLGTKVVGSNISFVAKCSGAGFEAPWNSWNTRSKGQRAKGKAIDTFQVSPGTVFTVMACRQNIRGLLALRKALLETRSEQIGRQVVRQEGRQKEMKVCRLSRE